jgi:hypothetical protein
MRLITFFEDVLQSGTIQSQIGDDLLELGVLFAQLTQLAISGVPRIVSPGVVYDPGRLIG